VEGDHPLPGAGSFAAAHQLLGFLDQLRVQDARLLTVHLSGGASSLAWLRPVSLPPAQLHARLSRLYRQGWGIARLNRERARLCGLKAGGAARWARWLAPQLRVRVEAISDVAPDPLKVVGSGPFWDGSIPHRLLADNATWVRQASRALKAGGIPVLDALGARRGSIRSWHRQLRARTRAALRAGREGVLLLGGEPALALPRDSGRGGRQTHLAALFAQDFLPELRSGRLEALFLASDGVDGSSGAAGAWLRASAAQRLRPERLLRAIRAYDAASELARAGALIASRISGTNVQDLAAVWLRPAGKPLA
jgi:glycerate 2-kinase